jgi:hypothetical protein
MSDDSMTMKAAKDYYKAQQPELDALRKDGNYSAWQWIKDAPATGMAKGAVYRATDPQADMRSVGGNLQSPGSSMDNMMEGMRTLSTKQHSNPDYLPNRQEQQLTDHWNALQNGSVWLRMPEQK